MDEIDKRRKEEFRKHEMEKEHKRRKEEKGFDEAKKKEVEEERKRLREKHMKDAQRVNHPVSKNIKIYLLDFESNHDIYLVDPAHPYCACHET